MHRRTSQERKLLRTLRAVVAKAALSPFRRNITAQQALREILAIACEAIDANHRTR